MNTASASKLILALTTSRNMPACNIQRQALVHNQAWKLVGMKAAGSCQHEVQQGVGKKGACLANGVQVGKACQSFSTDVGDHVLVQGHIRGMHEVCNTTATTVLHHNPQRLTAAPTALYTTTDLTTRLGQGVCGVGGLRVGGWEVLAYGICLQPLVPSQS